MKASLIRYPADSHRLERKGKLLGEFEIGECFKRIDKLPADGFVYEIHYKIRGVLYALTISGRYHWQMEDQLKLVHYDKLMEAWQLMYEWKK